jgi:signal peptidase I
MFTAQEVLSFVGETLKIVIISLLIILPIRYFVVQPFFVRGASMEPSFYNGDYLIVDEISYRFGDPQRGDVIVFRFPQNASQYYIKRIIGLPGEKVEMRAGKVFITGEQDAAPWELKEPYIDPSRTSGDTNIDLGIDELFVLGDNRMASYDSRQWGALTLDYIMGRAWIRAWPITNVGVIKQTVYSTK